MFQEALHPYFMMVMRLTSKYMMHCSLMRILVMINAKRNKLQPTAIARYFVTI